MTTKEDRLKYKNYFYNPYTKELIGISPYDEVDKRWTPHHRVNQQWIRHNPEKFKEIEHEQQIIFLPTFVQGFDNMHYDADNRNSRFKGKWGIPLERVLYDTRD